MLRPMKAHLFAAALLLLAALAPNARAEPLTRARAPVVVELYSSQGCSQCPRANRLLGMLSREPGLIALTFPVGYWDYLGWVDTFAEPEFSSRQRDYSRAMHVRAPFTPQLIIDGLRQVSAADWDEARAALDEVQATPAAPGAPTLASQRVPHSTLLRVTIGAGVTTTPANIWMMSYDPGPLTVLVRSGENINRVVTHYNLVRRAWLMGAWNGEPATVNMQHCVPQCAVLIQSADGGRVLAAAMTRRSDPRP